MARLPVPGRDVDVWGEVLNDFLEVSHNSDGTLRLSAIVRAGGYAKPLAGIPASDLAGNIPQALFDTTTQTLINSVAGKYTKPATGIPASDLAYSVQRNLAAASSALQSGTPVTNGDLTGTYGAPTVAKIQGTAVSSTAPTSGQALLYNGSQWVPGTVSDSGSTVSDATTTSKGILQLSGDLAGTASSPSVAKINGVAVTGTPSSGQALIASSGTAAAWTAVPSAPVSSVNGQTGAVELDVANLGDTNFSTLANNQVLTYDSGKWINATPAGGVVLDTSASDIQPDTTTGTAAIGNTGKAADAGHQHPLVAHDHTTTTKGGQIPIGGLSATGTASSSTFLRGDNTWATPSTASGATTSTPGLVAFSGGDLSEGSGAGIPKVVSLNGGITLPSSAPTSAGQVLTTAGSGGSTSTTWTTPAAGVQLDNTSSDIQPLGSQAAGSSSMAAKADHVHAMPRLDQVNTPQANISMTTSSTAYKITGLANGTAATDAAAFGQIPIVGAAGSGASNALSANDPTTTNSRTPTGTITGGDLTGSYPSPTLSATTNVESIISGNTTVAGALQKANNLNDVVDAGSSRANIHIPALTPAACVATSNVSSLSGFQTFDGYTLTNGDLVLLTNQTTASQNGLWTAASGSWTRPTEFATGLSIKGRTCAVLNGTAYASTNWVLNAPTAGIVVDTSSQTWNVSGLTNASIKNMPDWLNVKAYGAMGNGTADDTAAIQSAISALGSNGGTIYFPTSTSGYLLNSSALTLPTAGTILRGGGAENTKLLIGSSFSGTAAIQVQAYNCQVVDLSVDGLSSTTTSNPVCNGIEITGVRRTKIDRCSFFYINGWAIEATATSTSSSTNPLGTQILQAFGQSCAGGIHFLGNTTQGYAMNCQVTDAQFYGTGVTSGASANLDGIRVEDSWDVLSENVLLWMGAGTGSSYHIKGNSAAQFISNLDALGSKAGPCVLIEDGTNGSPQNLQIQGGVIQQGTVGLSMTGAGYQVHIATSRIISNQTHGIQIGGTGGSINVYNCFFNLNGAGASGTNYDLNWSGTSTGKVLGCSFNTAVVATGVAGIQDSVNIAAGQNVMFEGVNFAGTGAALTNWFTNLPSGVLEVGSGANFVTPTIFNGASSSTTRAIVSQPAAASYAAFAVNVAGNDNNDRFRISGDGSLHVGPGTAGRDTAIGRATSGVAYVNNNLLITSTSAPSSSLGDNGSGEIQLANAGTVPTTNPSGGVALYASSGNLYYRNPSGFAYDLSRNSTTSTGTTVVNSTNTLTAIASGSTVAASALAAGQVYTFKAWGILSTAATADTFNFALYWGGISGTQLLSWGAGQPSNSVTVTNVSWTAQFEIVANSATSLSVSGWNALDYFMTSFTNTNTTVSNTAAKQFVIGVTPSDTGSSVTCNGFYCMRIV